MLHPSPVAVLQVNAPESLVWVSVENVGAAQARVSTIVSVTVVGMPVFVRPEEKLMQAYAIGFQPSNQGVLSDGERYVVYRVSLYADGFQKNKSARQSKSVGGVYILPLGLPSMERMSAQAVRPLCLTPHGCSVNGVIKIIMKDLEKAVKEGVVGVDPDGRNVRIFIDTVSLIGDFPPAAAFTDVLGHTATAVCKIFTMRHRKGGTCPRPISPVMFIAFA